jgi:hypothetical protein
VLGGQVVVGVEAAEEAVGLDGAGGGGGGGRGGGPSSPMAIKAVVARDARTGEETRHEADAFVFAVGVKGLPSRDYTYGPCVLPYNIARSATDTLVAKIAQHRPLPQVLTQKGNWRQQKRAKKLTQFIEGEFYRQRFFETHARKFIRDALVFGRGILHLSVLIETMRREGYELQIGKPRVLLKEIDGATHEPFEHLVIDVPQEVAGKATELVMMRKGQLRVMEAKGDLQHLEFRIPSRGLIGLRNQVLTATAGEAVMTHRFDAYEPWAGELATRNSGSLISAETGQARAYEIDRLQDRGTFFIDPGEEVYKGQVVGECARDNCRRASPGCR